jgi:hypothetical protein
MGSENHFHVPENYFDRFAADLMQKLPEEAQPMKLQNQPLIYRLRPTLYAAAACLILAVFSAPILFNRADSDNAEQQMVASMQDAMNDAYLDATANYAMVDNSDIYAYLSYNE